MWQWSRKVPVILFLVAAFGHLAYAQEGGTPVALPNEMMVFEAVTSDGGAASPERIAAYAEQLADSAPSDLAGLLRLGIAWQLSQEPTKARSMFEQAVALDPNNPTLYPRLAGVADEGITVYVMGKRVVFPDARPEIVNGRTLVPFRAIAEALGAEVSWDSDTKTATIKLGEREVRLTQDSKLALIGLNPQLLDVPAALIPPGRFAVPLRFVGQALGYKIHWIEIHPGAAVIGIYQELKEGN